MRVTQFYKRSRPTFSFEFFPPKTDEGEAKLFDTVRDLKRLEPSFVSVTYGAMGTTRDNTLRIVEKIKKTIGIEAAAHLTCVGQTRDEIGKILEDLHRRGIENIVALRGDPPKGETEYKPFPDGFAYGYELVRFIRQHDRLGNAFSIAVAGYPEGHVECRDKKKDLDYLKLKVDQGADVIITQLFFTNQDYFDFVERARCLGISQPIVPGIMPVTQGQQIQKFAQMCGAAIPLEMTEAIEKYSDEPASIEAYGIEYATKQCEELLHAGVPGIHFYTLNKSRATVQIYGHLGLPDKMPK
ncbi:MAG TPA: methylenetetrahydrofolate reductase [NAD(P)H] [bacterium]|nr:methylenetetrahydrofolate reductase [NAD(P)H] [bacterium]